MDTIYQIILHGDKAIAWLGALLAGFILRYVVLKIGSEKVRAIVDRACREVFNATEEVWQTYVSALKEANADGKLTEEEKALARRRAIEMAKSNIGKKGLAALARALGLGDLDSWLGTKVESSVNALKLAGKTAKGKAGNP